MAFCSRGCGFGRDLILVLPRSASLQTWTIRATRAFETSAYLRAKHKPSKPSAAPARKQRPAPRKPPPPPTLQYRPQSNPTPPAAATTAAAEALSVAERLARRGERTLLYQAPSHFWLRASALSASVFCMGYVGVHYWTTMVYPPEGLAWWVPHAFVPILLTMGYFSSYFALSATNIVRSVTAVPRRLLPPSCLAGGAAKRSRQEERSLAALNASPIALEVAVTPLVPLLPPRKIVAAPNEVVLPFKLQSTPAATGRAPRAELPARRGGVTDRIAAPFEALGRAVKGPFGGITRALTRAGFAKIEVKGAKYKVDILAGKALENGRILDHLVAYRPDKPSFGSRLW